MSSADPTPSTAEAALAQESPWSIPRGLLLLLGRAGGFVVTVIPIQQRMLRRGWPKWIAIATVVAGAYEILLVLGLILLYAGARLATLVASYAPSTDEVNKDVANLLDSLGIGQKQTHRLRYTATSRPDISGALTNFTSETRTYLSVATIFGGIVAFVKTYIPNIGLIIGVIPPAMLGLLVGGWKLTLLVIVVYSVINYVIQSIIQPQLVGDSVNLATTVTFLSMAIWT